MFIRLKKFLMHSRILSYTDEELQQAMKAHLPFKFPHLSEPFDKSFRDQENPMLKHSVMHQLSKAVGKTSIAPLEIAQHFMTAPKADLTLFTLDQEEL